METNVTIIENEGDLLAAEELVSSLMDSDNPVDRARLRAQAGILQAYEAQKWPVREASVAEIIQYIM